MAGTERAPADLFVVGANHRSSSAMLRDRLFVEDAALPDFYDSLRASGIEQAVVLSTCDRVEIQGAHAEPERAAKAVLAALAERAGLTAEAIMGEAYIHRGEEAVRQIFAVAASLDSMMIGESQVLGQVKAGHRLAQAAGMTGPELEAALQAAYAAAKRIRTETTIGERPVSIAAAAIQLARDLHGDLSRRSALLLGVGDMGEDLAERLLDAGLARLVVAHPSEARAEALARRLESHVHPFETFAVALSNVDIVVAALGTGRTIVTHEMLAQALRQRRRRPIFVIDVAIPSDVDPAVNRLDDAFLYDLDELESVALAGRADREAAAAEAWRILDQDLAAFLGGQVARQANEAIVALRRRFEVLRHEVLASAPDNAEEATRRLINRLLHDPSEALRALATDDPGARAGADRLLKRLFQLGVTEDRSEDEENEA